MLCLDDVSFGFAGEEVMNMCSCCGVLIAEECSPSAARLLLMACVSFRRSPLAPEDFSLSLPARSIRFSTPAHRNSIVMHTDRACNKLMIENCTHHRAEVSSVLKFCTRVWPEAEQL